jgi:predicted glycosyltransferase
MAPSTRHKLLFYCQSLVGLGHLTSSLLLIRELLEHADVDLIYGGQTVREFPEHPGFRHLRLQTVLIDNESGVLFAADSDLDLKAVWDERRAAIDEFLSARYDATIVEFFPFGRRRLKQEILSLFERVRRSNTEIPILTFVREILVPEGPETERRIVALIDAHIHSVYVRGDPNIVRFEETFSLTHEIADKLHYVGYVSPPSPTHWPSRDNRIIVSQGGGEIGLILLRAAIEAAPSLPQYRFVIVCSSRATAEECADLKARVSSSNVEIVPFLTNFQQHLMQSALSISLGGDNTLMDVISTQTPALAFPYMGNSEQVLRIGKLAAKGFIDQLAVEDLAPARLCMRIEAILKRSYPEQTLMLDGARVLSRRIRNLLEDQSYRS